MKSFFILEKLITKTHFNFRLTILYLINFSGEKYGLAQFHFHWAGSNHGRGSEHTLNGNYYFAEVCS